MRLARRLVLVVLVLALIYASVTLYEENDDTIQIHYIVGSFDEVPVWMALLVAFAAGLASATLWGVMRGARLRLESRRYRKAARQLEAEVHQLRNLPLADEPGRAGAGDDPVAEAAAERGS